MPPTDAPALQLPQLGLREDDALRLGRLLCQSQGLVLIGGPRGSGVSTSLAAMRGWMLAQSAGAALPMLLLEPGHSPAALRQAVACIPQGCRVLAGAHLARAAHAFAHCRDHGVPLDAVSRHVLLVMAQRLLPRLCRFCRRPDDSAELRAALARAGNSWLAGTPIAAAQAHRPGCSRCQGGVAGCVLIYEWLPADAGVRAMIEANAIGLDLEQALFADGRSLWDDGLRQLACGQVSLAHLRQALREPA